MNVYERIQNLCNEKGISISKLEKYTDVGNGVIKKWEQSTSPKVTSLIKIADYFNVSLDYLVGQTNIRHFSNYSEQIENGGQDKILKLEIIIENLISDLNRQRLTLNRESIEPDVADVIKNMLSSNLEAWRLMSGEKKFRKFDK